MSLVISDCPFQALMQAMVNWTEYLVLIRISKFHPDKLHELEARYLILHYNIKLCKLADFEE